MDLAQIILGHQEDLLTLQSIYNLFFRSEKWTQSMETVDGGVDKVRPWIRPGWSVRVRGTAIFWMFPLFQVSSFPSESNILLLII